MPKTTQFDRLELIAFFRAVDARLSGPGTLRLLGGAAIGLCHLPVFQTRDIDYSWADPQVQAAITAVQPDWPGVPVQRTGVYFAPYSHEERLEVVEIPGLRRLTVQVPERHDLAIMKLARGFDRDLDAVEQMHRAEPLHLDTLVERFAETWITGPQRLADIGFFSVIETLFGEQAADAAEAQLHERRRSGD